MGDNFQNQVQQYAAAMMAAEASADAYMRDAYGEAEWLKVAEWLATEKDFDVREIEAILRSKYMRWASDFNNGKCTASAFKKAWKAWGIKMTGQTAIDDLVVGTFGSLDA